MKAGEQINPKSDQRVRYIKMDTWTFTHTQPQMHTQTAYKAIYSNRIKVETVDGAVQKVMQTKKKNLTSGVSVMSP